MPDHERRQDVAQGGQFGEEMIELKDHAEILIAQQVALFGRQVVDPPLVQQDLSLFGPVERPQQVHQGALATTALPHNRQKLAAINLQIDFLQDGDYVGAFVVPLADPAGGQLELATGGVR